MPASLLSRVKERLRGTPASAAEVGAFDADFYDEAYKNVEEYRRPYYNSRYYFVWTVMLDRLLGQQPVGVLEVGCGPGQLASLLLEHGIQNYLGFDFSPEAIGLARANSSGRFEVADARDTNLFQSHNYDAILCTEVLEHIDFDIEVIERFPAGVRCICSVPSFPYISHVRHFPAKSGVYERYAAHFDDFKVLGLRMPGKDGDWYYLFDGIRNDHRSQ